MNVSYSSENTMAPAGQKPAETAVPAAKGNSTWVASLTLICLLFGGLMALQLRSVQRVRDKEARTAEGIAEQQSQLASLKGKLEAEASRTKSLNTEIAALNNKIKGSAKISKVMASQLNSQLKQLQMLSGLTPVKGEGVRLVLTDNPDAAKNAGGSTWVPGMVHDYDLLQVVNELRGAKAEAISVNGTRINGYTPIRCVGPTILVNFQPATPPFVIEAIGNPETLMAALRLPNGIVDNLKNNAGLGVRMATVDDLKMAASENMPKLQVAKATN